MLRARVVSPDAQPAPLSGAAAAAARFVRDEHIEAGYSAGRHIALTLTIAAAISALGVVLASRAHVMDWLLMPAFLVVANLIEWTVHRYPMHRPLPPRLLYKNHAQIHHVAFANGDMSMRHTRELALIMMPWYTMLGLFLVASPVMIVAAMLRGPGLAGVFLLAAVAYFLTYEALHALYHVPGDTLARMGLARRRLFRALQTHHARHHVLRRMAAVNFNVTVPLMDRVFGTLERPAPDGGGAGPGDEDEG
jgi:Fatty acid hydroxylase superfamily